MFSKSSTSRCYRLYDVDRIISRTLAYAIVTGLLVGVYAGLVLLATRVMSFSSPVAVAASTLAAPALFSPVRRRVQRIVNRRFNRTCYNADQTIAAFAARPKDAVDLGAVRDDLSGVVQKALEPAHVSVWMRPPDAPGWREIRVTSGSSPMPRRGLRRHASAMTRPTPSSQLRAHGHVSRFRYGYTDQRLRVSDAERTEVADRLAAHFGEGRLDGPSSTSVSRGR